MYIQIMSRSSLFLTLLRANLKLMWPADYEQGQLTMSKHRA